MAAHLSGHALRCREGKARIAFDSSFSIATFDIFNFYIGLLTSAKEVTKPVRGFGVLGFWGFGVLLEIFPFLLVYR